ncbi:MAG: type II secretion system F family protein [Planctomycetes bacterium]|nr:type II secretion system F family protein [Planctomycetota bacterium]
MRETLAITLLLVLTLGWFSPAFLLLLAYAHRDRSQQLEVFCRHLASVVRQNLPIPGGLAALEADTSAGFARRCRRLRLALESGASLSKALQLFPRAFALPFVRAIEAAERTGNLASVLEEFAGSAQHRAELFSRVYGAAAYLVLLVSAWILPVSWIYVMPSFEKVFSDLGKPFPPLVQASRLYERYASVGVAFLGFGLLCIPAVGLVLDGPLLRRFLWLRWPLDLLQRCTPLAWSIARTTATIRFARMLALLLRGGTPMREAMELATRLEAQRVLDGRFRYFAALWGAGVSLADAARRAALPRSLVWMLDVGERNGDLPDLLDRCARHLEEDLRTRVERLRQVILPACVLFAGSVVAAHAFVTFESLIDLIRGMA